MYVYIVLEYIGVSVWGTCVCLYMCMFVHIHVCRSPKHMSEIPLGHSSTLLFEAVFREPACSRDPQFPTSRERITGRPPYQPGSDMGSKDPNSSPRFCSKHFKHWAFCSASSYLSITKCCQSECLRDLSGTTVCTGDRAVYRQTELGWGGRWLSSESTCCTSTGATVWIPVSLLQSQSP